MTENSTFARRARAARPREKRHDIRDDVVSGLTLRIFPSGARSFTLESIANRAMPVLSMMMRMAELWGYRPPTPIPARTPGATG